MNESVTLRAELPCKSCAQLIYTDGEDFWKWDPQANLFRMVSFEGEFYPLTTHPGITQPELVAYVGKDLRVARETDIVWRTVRLVLEGLQTGNWLQMS